MDDRIKCKYPWSIFYVYEDEILVGERVSTLSDCLGCDECETCDEGHCLITEK